MPFMARAGGSKHFLFFTANHCVCVCPFVTDFKLAPPSMSLSFSFSGIGQKKSSYYRLNYYYGCGTCRLMAVALSQYMYGHVNNLLYMLRAPPLLLLLLLLLFSKIRAQRGRETEDAFAVAGRRRRKIPRFLRRNARGLGFSRPRRGNNTSPAAFISK